MSIFNIDWNYDDKIDYKDTLFDFALIDACDDEADNSEDDYGDYTANEENE